MSSDPVQLTRRHRAVVLSLAVIAGGVFLVFVLRGSLIDVSPEQPRACGTSTFYEGLSFPEARRMYHWTMEQLIEERMNLYDGHTLLHCSEPAMESVIPPGALASAVAERLPTVPDPPRLHFTDFTHLLTEFWRTYDCHLQGAWPGGDGDTLLLGDAFFQEVYGERIRARTTLDRLLTVLRASEHYLPLHAASRCLQRGATDVRNAVALLSDANQCALPRLSQPETSLLK